MPWYTPAWKTSLKFKRLIFSILFRESITETVPFDFTYKKQSGGRGQFGRIAGTIEINEDDEFEFINNTKGGVIPNNYFSGIKKVKPN